MISMLGSNNNGPKILRSRPKDRRKGSEPTKQCQAQATSSFLQQKKYLIQRFARQLLESAGEIDERRKTMMSPRIERGLTFRW